MLSAARLYLAIVVSSAVQFAQDRYSCSYSPTLSPDMSTALLARVFYRLDYVSGQHSTGISGACRFTLFPARGRCRNRFVCPVRSGGLLSALCGGCVPLSIFAPEALDFFSYEDFTTLSGEPVDTVVSFSLCGLSIKCSLTYTKDSRSVGSASAPIIGNVWAYVYHVVSVVSGKQKTLQWVILFFQIQTDRCCSGCSPSALRYMPPILLLQACSWPAVRNSCCLLSVPYIPISLRCEAYGY